MPINITFPPRPLFKILDTALSNAQLCDIYAHYLYQRKTLVMATVY